MGVVVCRVLGCGGRVLLGGGVLLSGAWWARCRGRAVYGAGGVWRWRRLSSGRVFRGWSVLWWGTVRRVWWVMVAGMLVSRRWIVLGSQARAEASARAGVWEKVGRSAGRGHDRASDAVLREALRRDVVEPGVFCAADAVPWRRVRGRWRTSRPGSWPPLCWWRGRWVGGFCDVLEARPGALVGLLVARGWPACPGARRLGPAGRRVSAACAPFPGWPSALYAGDQAVWGMVPVGLRCVVGQGEPLRCRTPGGG